MKFNFNFSMLLLAALVGAFPPPLLAQETEELRRQVEALRQEVARLESQGSTDARLRELERRIDILAAEIERARTGGAVEAEPGKAVPGFGPAASKVYRTA
ncbi:MAG TPA: hypothetical protein VLI67_11640, partial [Vicinamibacteria bacterium]|nr:hypothetical protein [Vicinamibacteria bacterium]